MGKLTRVSLITLGVLFSFVFFIIVLVGLYTDHFSLPFALGLTIVFNFLAWILSPFFSDFIYRAIYSTTFFSEDQFKLKYLDHYNFLKPICEKYGVKFPKFGVIDDGNPTAFSYGSHKQNPRIIFTAGLFKYLSTDEINAVLAHEMGHIVHNDFIVMTIATTLVQVLYELYVWTTKTKSDSKSKKSEGKSSAAIVGLISYVLYLIGSYLVLFLSRTREYYADEFAAQETGDPHLLSEALIQIAYGIVEIPDTENSKRLLHSTRSLGLIDVKNAGSIAGFWAAKGDKTILAEIMSFDLVSPWAPIIELSSTHPLTGKRIKALEVLASSSHRGVALDFDKAIGTLAIDKNRLYHNFYRDLCMYCLGHILAIIGIITGAVVAGMVGVVGGAVVGFSLGALINSFYKYPKKTIKPATILECMRNPYASPLKGEYISLTGNVVGKGMPGYIFSEDMMFQDPTGIIYLDNVTLFGFLTDIWFAVKKLKELLRTVHTVQADGWFTRSIMPQITLSGIHDEGKTTSSYPYIWERVSAIMGIILGLAFIFYL